MNDYWRSRSGLGLGQTPLGLRCYWYFEPSLSLANTIAFTGGRIDCKATEIESWLQQLEQNSISGA